MLLNILSQTIRADGLALYRFFFAIVLAYESLRQRSFLCQYFSKSSLYFPHFGLNFIKPLPRFYFQLLILTKFLCSVFFALGLYFPYTSKLLFAIQLYLFLLDKTLYSDAAYLRLLFLGLFCFVDAACVLSLDSYFREVKELPYWKLLLFQGQILIAYSFRAFWKFMPDWRQSKGLFLPFLNFFVWRKSKHYSDFSAFFSQRQAYWLEKQLKNKALQKMLLHTLPIIELSMVWGLFIPKLQLLFMALFLFYQAIYHLFSEREFPCENYALVLLWGWS